MNYLKLLLRRLMGVDIIKVFSLNAVSTLIRMLAGIISVKIVAAIIGPAGVALIGQLNNITSILLGVANGCINNGITKYVAEYREDKLEIRKLLSNALRITLFFTFIVALFLIVFHNYLSRWIMLSDEYGYIFLIFGFTIVLYTLNALLISVLNGFREFRKYVAVNICGTFIGLIFSITLVFFWGLTGAMINAVTFQSVMFFVTLWMCRKYQWMKLCNFSGHLDSIVIRRYLGYSLMAFTTLSLGPVSQMLLRGYVISEVSIIEAGWWEAMNRISSMYLSVITTSFAVYYLPRLSEIKDNLELHHEIFRCYKVIVPILIIVTVVIYLLRHFVIWLLFTSDFYPMERFFIWQMLGDFFKIASWLLSYLMVAKAMTKAFITTEVIFTLFFIGLGYVFIHVNGTIGLTQAYMINYILYLSCMVIMFRRTLFPTKYE